jgi:hypothetical protein
VFSNNFFVADTTLLVEGPSDAVYVTSIMRTFNRLGNLDADLNLFSIVDAGNAVDFVAMARLMVDEGRKVVALVDGDDGGARTKAKLEQLNHSLHDDLPKVSIHRLPDGMSIEDVLPFQDGYREAVINACESLVRDGIRNLADGIQQNQIRTSLTPVFTDAHPGVTLGKVVEDATERIFSGEEAISKLHVARAYDDVIELRLDGGQSPDATDLALNLCRALTERLALSEKKAQEVVFGE